MRTGKSGESAWEASAVIQGKKEVASGGDQECSHPGSLLKKKPEDLLIA